MITLTGEDRTAHLSMQAVSPSIDIDAGKWQIGPDTAIGDDVAIGSIAVGPGFTGSMDISLVRPEESTATISAKTVQRYLDAAGNTLSETLSSAFTIDSTEVTKPIS